MEPGTLRPDQTRVSRRAFVSTALAIGGGLALSVALPVEAQEAGPRRLRPGAGPPAAAVRSPAAFLQIGTDDAITVISPAVEMGQGEHTAMPMIILDELGGGWQHLRHVEDAPAAPIYDNPMMRQQSTVGSFSVRGWYAELRRIGAAAREMLIAAAAREWGVPASQCSAADSVITHHPTGRTRSFGSVAALAAHLPVPQHPQLKPAGHFTLIGTSPPRVDIPAKVNGSARYGIDVKLPGMLYAAIQQCPTLHGRLKSFDDTAARRMPGFHATVALPDGVMVVARNFWQATKALGQVKVEYDLGPLANLDSAQVSRMLHEGFDERGAIARNDGDATAALARAATRMEAVYEVPFLAHACMEPMNCMARVNPDGSGEVWCGTQSPQAVQAAAAAVLQIPPTRVAVHTMYLGGGFGRRGEADYATQAMTAAKAVGRPVKLIWSREQDIQHDFYRPAEATRFRAGLDRSGRLIALDAQVVTASRPPLGPPNGPPDFTGGISDANYAIPNFRVTGVDKHVGVRFGFWRSVNDSHNPFMLEGFIDEIARRAGRDPYEFRRGMLQHPGGRRQLAVLDLLADKADWRHPPAGHSYGIAAVGAFGSFIGTVVDLSLTGKTFRLHRVLTAIDCGVAVDPGNIRAQLESGMVFGLTAALRGQITLKHGAVQQGNFDTYPMLRLAQMPQTECFVVPSSEAPGGVGEPGTATIAPALANALYAAAGGERVRSLPLSVHGLTLATRA